jgi:hypothetical protein
MSLIPMNLRIEAHSGFEEYRICEGSIEVRKLRRVEVASEGGWQRLNHADLAAHVHENSVVAQWLRKTIGWQRLLRLCVNPETLEEFGIAENTLDPYAA